MKPSFYTNKKGEQCMEFRVFKAMKHETVWYFLKNARRAKKK